MDQLVELSPDVIGLQELRHFVPPQAGWIAREAGRRTARAHWFQAAYKTGLYWFWEGIGILTRLPVVEPATLPLPGDHRVAVVARLRLPDGGVLDFYNTHVGGRSEEKRAEVETLMRWMATRSGTPQVLVGDFNATPTSAVMQPARQALRSAFVVVHGTEPDRTVPTPLRHGTLPPGGDVLDYILVSGDVEVHDATVVFDRAAPEDPTIYASDHFGLAATISITDHSL